MTTPQGSSSEEDQKANSSEENKGEQQQSEEGQNQNDGYAKDGETVEAARYNQSLRKQREIELENRELKKKVEESEKAKAAKEDNGDDKDGDDDKDTVEALVDSRVKPVLERLEQKEEDDKRKERDSFFRDYPQYLNAAQWQSLLDELGTSINPKSKDSYYKQLVKAHRIISGEKEDPEIEKKKREMAANLASKGDGSQNNQGSVAANERAQRLASQMPKGYVFKQ